MKKIDVEPTAEVIDKMAKFLSEASTRMTNIANRMRENGDIEYATEAMVEATNITNNLRLDLLVSRPLRATNWWKD